ncbi:glycosyltransferase family 4 protein [uncultured Agrobacterium sp.]|uniref:glycosyltransferase family 4 protein n=1 Tax=uncultured Agrobacterium sp. TaxID=157277 RepID=UPI00258308C2|nr:glycosyltransferase family 4 protein [uncultured Agrobacterium sp.]
MRVLHVYETIPGGPATYFNETVPAQIEKYGAENVRVIVPASHLSHIKNTPSSCIATFKRKRRYRSLPALARAVVAEVKSFRPDVVHAHSTFAGVIVRSIGAVSKGFPPIVYCPHGWVFDMQTLGPFRLPAQWVERLLAPFCRKIVAISHHEYQRGLSAGIDARRMIVIENGISGNKPLAVPVEWNDPRTKVLFIGRLDRQKGVDILLKAAEGLEERAVFKVIGAHVTTKNTMSSTVPDNVELCGWKSPEEIAGYLSACDVVVMPSRWEGFGLVALEAMRSEKAVIASAVGGLQSVVKHGETGLLFPAEDHQALRQAILSHDKPGWAQMGAAGYQRFMAHYRSDRTNAELMSLYDEVSSKAQARARVLA